MAPHTSRVPRRSPRRPDTRIPATTRIPARQLPDVNVLEPERVPVVLQLDLARRGQWLAAGPEVVQGHVVHDQLAVEVDGDLVADQADEEGVPLADGLVRLLERLRVVRVVEQPAGADGVLRL